MNKIKLSVLRNNLSCIAVLGLMFWCLSIIGCANRLYSINMNYDAGKANIPAYLKAEDKGHNALITIAEFVDTRKVDDPMVVGRVVEKDGMKTLVLPKYTKPVQAVTNGIRRYLLKAGYKISANAGQWDLKEETISKVDGKLIIGGSIEELDVTCRKGFPTDSYKAGIKLTLVLADPAKGKILYRSSVESNTSLEHVSFSENRLAEQINIALGDAIEKIFEDRNVAQKLKEAVTE
ncbi:MAG: hypothetical protein AB2L12_14545 [Smithellaceae bacterium]